MRTSPHPLLDDQSESNDGQRGQWLLATLEPAKQGNRIPINLAYAPRASVWRNIKVVLATLGLVGPERV